jgi:NTE family protein
VATHPEIDTATAPPAAPPPDVYDVVVRLMDATLVDRMIEDLRTLIKVNTLVDSAEHVTATGRTQKAIPFLAIAPPARATLGQLAEQIFQNQRERWQGVVPTFRQAELRMLGRAVGGGGPRRGDLFSYLYFDPEFIEASIELGRRNAEAVFEGLPPDQLPWQTGPRQLLTTP